MNRLELKQRLPTTAFAFRGYNLTNLGRTRELLLHPQFGPIVEQHLRDASEVCREFTSHRTDLVDRVRRNAETSLSSYQDAIGLIVAVEMAQLQLLEEFFGIPYHQAKVMFGYSLGEITALIAGGVIPLRCALQVPLALAGDCVELAHDVTLGILFCREQSLPLEAIRRLCVQINQLGMGTMGISAYLSPNSLLVMGEGRTLDEFREQLIETVPQAITLRKHQGNWPPLHTPILWRRNVPNRAAEMMQQMPFRIQKPVPPVLSLVTGELSYNDYNARELLHRWIDHPQRLWDVVYATLALGIDTIVHVGPEPNILPATYKRLRDNVEVQTKGSLGMRALSMAVSRPWLNAMLPARSALLRAPLVRHVVLEDWLLEQQAMSVEPPLSSVA